MGSIGSVSSCVEVLTVEGLPLNLVLYIPFRIFMYTEKKTFSLVVVFVVIKEEDFGLHHDT